MSSISNISVFDGASTPTLHVFVAVSVKADKPNRITATWRETGMAVPTDAQPRLTISLEQLVSGVYKVERKLVVPVMEAVAGANSSGFTAAPKVAHELSDIHIGYFHGRSDVAGRRLIRQMGVNLDGGVATSVAPVVTGPVAELFDLLVSPT